MTPKTERKQQFFRIAVSVGVLALFLTATLIFWKPIVSLFKDPEVFRLWVEEKGWGARSAFVGMLVLQIVLALIPGEPLEIAAGFAFGSVEGLVLCLCGIAIGSTLVFLFVRFFGVKLVELFFPIEKIRSLRLLQNSRRFDMLLFLIMFIPGTPKDLISYFVGLTEMKLSHWIVLTTLARIPSVVTSTVGGDALGEENYLFAIIVFVVTAIISLLGIWYYDRIQKKKKEKSEGRKKDA